MNETFEYSQAIQDAWSRLESTRRKWKVFTLLSISPIFLYLFGMVLFKISYSLTLLVIFTFIAVFGKYLAYRQTRLAEDRYYGEFPALIPEDE